MGLLAARVYLHKDADIALHAVLLSPILHLYAVENSFLSFSVIYMDFYIIYLVYFVISSYLSVCSANCANSLSYSIEGIQIIITYIYILY